MVTLHTPIFYEKKSTAFELKKCDFCIRNVPILYKKENRFAFQNTGLKYWFSAQNIPQMCDDKYLLLQGYCILSKPWKFWIYVMMNT